MEVGREPCVFLRFGPSVCTVLVSDPPGTCAFPSYYSASLSGEKKEKVVVVETILEFSQQKVDFNRCTIWFYKIES